jgi:hypothetical protein
MTVQRNKLPRQEWKRPWGTLQAWTCESGYRMVRAQVETTPQVLLMGYGDLHYGSPNCDLDMAAEVRDWIEKHGAFWIGMGDLIECATSSSVGAGWVEQVKTPDQQIDEIGAFLRPIRDLCLGLIKGNHEERAHKLCGIDPMGIVARELDVPYLGWEAWGVISRIPVAQRAWTFYGVHSSAGNKNSGLALNWTDREIRKFAQADVIMRAHSHDLGYMPVETMEFNTTGPNPSVERELRALVSTGHFLTRAGSYAAGSALAPKPPGSIALRLPVNRTSLRTLQPIWLPEGD